MAGGPVVVLVLKLHPADAVDFLINELLVAGGAGYVGSALIPRLLERGYSVNVVDLFWFGNKLPAETGLLSKDLFDMTVEDLKDYDQVIFNYFDRLAPNAEAVLPHFKSKPLAVSH